MESKLLKVPIVQELAKEKLSAVPSRYVRPEHHHLTPTDTSSLPQIPVIDMHNLLHSDSMESELHRLHQACQDWGFFQEFNLSTVIESQLINHGVEAAAIDKMRSEIMEFFNLPIEEKEKFRQKAEDVQGYGQAFVVSEEQKLDWADLFFVATFPTHLRRPHLIPNLPPAFRDAIDAYGEELRILALKIVNLLAKALGIKSEEIEAMFGEGSQTMRLNYYPPCPQPELVTGICPHSDADGVTILLQVNEIEGLQIKKEGKWIPVSPLPGAFVVNIGDIFEIVSNGTYRSVEHRATVNSEKERLSIAAFFSPRMDGDIYPAPSLVGAESPARFKRISVVEYFNGFFSKELKGKSYVDLMRIHS